LRFYDEPKQKQKNFSNNYLEIQKFYFKINNFFHHLCCWKSKIKCEELEKEKKLVIYFEK
jgi:hypothetical protein